ncbi:MAG: LysM peptidoglycan-binding domain-containing protein, partial [Elusimicrobiota bacterium]
MKKYQFIERTLVLSAALICAAPTWVLSEEPPSPQERYVVVKGDTLWGIAKMLYSDGFQWTRLHDANKQTVADPDVIIPQQTLILPGPLNMALASSVSVATGTMDGALKDDPQQALEPS